MVQRASAGPAGLEIAEQQVKQRQIPFRLCIVGINRLHLTVGGDGVIDAAHLRERRRLVDQGHDEVRPKRQRLVEPGQRLLVPAEILERRADIVADIRICRIELVRAATCADGFIKPPQRVQRDGALLHESCLTGGKRVALVEASQRLGRAMQAKQQDAAAKGGACIAGFGLEHALVTGERVGQLSQLHQRVAATCP